MLSVKKRKHRKKTRRKIKKGGNAVRVYHIPSDSETKLLYPIIEDIFYKTKNKIGIVVIT